MKIYVQDVPLVFENIYKDQRKKRRKKTVNENDAKKSKDDTSYYRVSLYNSKLNTIIINSNILEAN